MVRFAPALLVLALDIFCLIDVITTEEARVRNMPKVVWALLILFFPLIGSVAWLVAGRPQNARAGRSPYERPAAEFPEYDRPGRAAGLSPESDAEFLRKVRERAEEQRRRYADQQRAEQQKAAEQKAAEPESDDGPESG